MQEYLHFTARFKLRMIEQAIRTNFDPYQLLLAILYIVDPPAVRTNLQIIKRKLQQLE